MYHHGQRGSSCAIAVIVIIIIIFVAISIIIVITIINNIILILVTTIMGIIRKQSYYCSLEPPRRAGKGKGEAAPPPRERTWSILWPRAMTRAGTAVAAMAEHTA